MPYCTLQDLLDEFGETELVQLTDSTGSGTVDTVVVDRATARADREINRYLGGRADLPLLVDEVNDLACDIARYYLYAQAVPDHVKNRYDGAVTQLKAMAKRELAVADATGGLSAQPETVEMAADRTIFGRGAF